MTPRSTGDEALAAPLWPRLALAAVLLAGIATFIAVGGPHYLSLETIKEHRAALLEFTQQHYAQALSIALIAYVASTALSIPLGTLFALLLGFLFGRWVATALILVGATIGTSLLFLAVRHLFADAVRRRLGPKATRGVAGFAQNAFGWMLFLRLTPLVPYWLVNLVPAITHIRIGTYALATMLGIVPITLVVTSLGQKLGQIESLHDLLAPETLLLLALLGGLALVPVALRQALASRR
ncbi:MAG: VTT domain-containing protein [Casimicrobiaceae bacterium]